MNDQNKRRKDWLYKLPLYAALAVIGFVVVWYTGLDAAIQATWQLKAVQEKHRVCEEAEPGWYKAYRTAQAENICAPLSTEAIEYMKHCYRYHRVSSLKIIRQGLKCRVPLHLEGVLREQGLGYAPDRLNERLMVLREPSVIALYRKEMLHGPKVCQVSHTLEAQKELGEFINGDKTQKCIREYLFAGGKRPTWKSHFFDIISGKQKRFLNEWLFEGGIMGAF